MASNAMMCSRLVNTRRPIATLPISRIVSRITAKASWPTAVRTQIVGAGQIARVDLDGSGRFQRDVLELFLGHFDEGVGIDLVALDDVLVGDLLAGVGVYFAI